MSTPLPRFTFATLTPFAALALAACGIDPIANSADQVGNGLAPTATATPTVTNDVSAAPVDPAPAAGPGVALDSEGLRLVDMKTGSTVPLAFGTAQAATMEALAFRGPPGTGTNSECGAGPLDYASWPDGLTLHFQDDAFVGWTLNGRGEGALTTMSGIGIGSTRAELEGAYAATVTETTLGQEFAAGELYGILDGTGPAAKIVHMWSGLGCNFR